MSPQCQLSSWVTAAIHGFTVLLGPVDLLKLLHPALEHLSASFLANHEQKDSIGLIEPTA